MFNKPLQSVKLSYPASEEIPLLFDIPPKTIWYANSPGAEPARIPIKKFMEIYISKGGQPFDYTETVWYHPKVKTQANMTDHHKCYSEMRGQFTELLLRPNIGTEKVYFAYISPKVGFGVFARQKIPWLTLMGVYAGTFSSSLIEVDPVYPLSDANLKGWLISARRRGGWTRFIQQMPRSATNYYQYYYDLKCFDITNGFYHPGYVQSIYKEKLLDKAKFYVGFKQQNNGGLHLNDLTKTYPNIATANLNHEFYIMDGIPLFIFFATREIQAHEPLGIDYQRGYWNNKTPYFFNKQGQLSSPYEICEHCSVVDYRLLRCGHCKKVCYCNAECQRADWIAGHKERCQIIGVR